LWNLGVSGGEKKPEVAKAVAQQQQASDEQGPHIMLSYCWAQQPLVKEIAAGLKQAGYRIWLDIEQMAGSTLEAMASAVEGSCVVLVCMSRRYKESPNCRLEGEYTSNLRKDWIPLMVETDYKPDGWLGIMLGAKLWYDFRTPESFGSALEQVIKQLGERGKGGASITASPSTPTPTPAAAPAAAASSSAATATKVEPIKTTPAPAPTNVVLPPHTTIPAKALAWKAEDVKIWLEEVELPEYIPILGEHKIVGAALAELHILSIRHPKILFEFLKTWGPAVPIAQQLKLVFHLSQLQ